MNQYIIVLFKDNIRIYLGQVEDVTKLYYASPPYIPGTDNIEEAKRFDSFEEAQSFIYNLRYYQRNFLKVKTGIIKVQYLPTQNNIRSYKDYKIAELEIDN